MDRWHLSYLNFMEKFNCAYCAYANGLLAYATEIAARTEQYWCPIKHARKILGAPARAQRFLAYGDGENYQQRLAEFRDALAADSDKPDDPDDHPDAANENEPPRSNNTLPESADVKPA